MFMFRYLNYKYLLKKFRWTLFKKVQMDFIWHNKTKRLSSYQEDQMTFFLRLFELSFRVLAGSAKLASECWEEEFLLARVCPVDFGIDLSTRTQSEMKSQDIFNRKTMEEHFC